MGCGCALRLSGEGESMIVCNDSEVLTDTDLEPSLFLEKYIKVRNEFPELRIETTRCTGKPDRFYVLSVNTLLISRMCSTTSDSDDYLSHKEPAWRANIVTQ